MNEPPPTPSEPWIPLTRARAAAGRALGALAREPAAIRLAPAGDLRRMASRVEGVVLLATAHEAEPLLQAFLALPWLTGAKHPELDVAMGRSDDGIPIGLRVLPDDETAFTAQLLYLTARKDHFAALLGAADARGMLLDPQGLWRGEEQIPTPNEADVYAALDLPFVPPELREGTELSPPPEDLVAMDDIRGLVGVHTDHGAGRHTLPMMAERARREGYAWMLLADKGLEGDALRKQQGEILAAERIAAAEEAPLRILSAGAVKVLAHPRDDDADAPQDLEAWESVLDRCAEEGRVPLVSGGPDAAVLPAGWHDAVRARGLRVLPAADAHDLASIDDQICAVGELRRGRWQRGDVLSTRDAAEVLG